MDVTLEYNDPPNPVRTHEVEGVTIASDDCSIYVAVLNETTYIAVMRGAPKILAWGMNLPKVEVEDNQPKPTGWLRRLVTRLRCFRL